MAVVAHDRVSQHLDGEMTDKHFCSFPDPLPAVVEILAGIRVIPAQPSPPDTPGNGVDQAVFPIGNQ
jgi:hypothetical protein